MIPGVIIIFGKVSKEGNMRVLWAQTELVSLKGDLIPPEGGGLRRWSLLIKFLGSNEHLDCLKIDLTAVKL